MADPLPALTEPAPGGVCRVCEHRLNPGSLACAYCGAVYGAANRCPSCRAVAAVDSAAGLGRCKVCGALRFAVPDAAVVRTGREAPLLRRAERARRAAVLRVVLGALGGAAAFAALTGTLLVIGLAEPGSVFAGFGFVLAALGLLFGASLAGGARRADRERAEAVAQAQRLVAADVVASLGSVDARRLAALLGVDEAAAELLLAEIQVNDFLHARVTEDGEIGALPERLRLDAAAAESELEKPDPDPTRAGAARNPAR